MTRTLWVMWITVIAACGAAVAVTARGASAARDEARTQLAAFRGLSDRVSEYDRLRAHAARWPAAPVDSSLAQEVSATLAAAGLPASALANLSPDNGVAVPGSPGLIQLRAGLTLSNVTLPQLGRFLAEWRRRQPASGGGGWTVTGIDLTPEQAKADSRTTGGDLPLQAVLVIESMVTDGAE